MTETVGTVVTISALGINQLSEEQTDKMLDVIHQTLAELVLSVDPNIQLCSVKVSQINRFAELTTDAERRYRIT